MFPSFSLCLSLFLSLFGSSFPKKNHSTYVFFFFFFFLFLVFLFSLARPLLLIFCCRCRRPDTKRCPGVPGHRSTLPASRPCTAPCARPPAPAAARAAAARADGTPLAAGRRRTRQHCWQPHKRRAAWRLPMLASPQLSTALPALRARTPAPGQPIRYNVRVKITPPTTTRAQGGHESFLLLLCARLQYNIIYIIPFIVCCVLH